MKGSHPRIRTSRCRRNKNCLQNEGHTQLADALPLFHFCATGYVPTSAARHGTALSLRSCRDNPVVRTTNPFATFPGLHCDGAMLCIFWHLLSARPSVSGFAQHFLFLSGLLSPFSEQTTYSSKCPGTVFGSDFTVSWRNVKNLALQMLAKTPLRSSKKKTACFYSTSPEIVVN